MQKFLSNRIRTLLLVHKNIYHMKNWVDIAPDYAEKLESDSLPAGLSLSRMARLGQAKNVVEIGCGSGLLTRHWLKNLPDGVKYTSIDVSEAMIKIAERRKTEHKNLLNNNIQHEFVVGDIHDLTLIPDQSIDAYLGPLVYCHVADPSKALKEAMRVLKKGGRLGVSMGLPGSTSTFMTLLQNCKAKLNEQPKNGNQQQHHHHQRAIKGKDHLIQLVQEAGFEVEFCWEQEIIYDVLDENEASQLVKFPGGVNNTYSNLSEDLKPKFIENLKTEFTELKKTNTPLFNKCLLLTAIKP